MIPRKDSTFYRLNQTQKVLYLTGMPRQFILAQVSEFSFKNEKLNSKILTSTEQKKVFEQFKIQIPDSTFTVFNSSPTDYESMQCICSVLKFMQGSLGFNDFEFVSPYEIPPKAEQKIKSLYIVSGVNQSDESVTHQARRWVRSLTGAAIWISLTGPEPYKWMREKLGVKPEFLFSISKKLTESG